MPSKLNSGARCPVCDGEIVAIARITRHDGTTLEFMHDLNKSPRVVEDHVLAGDDATMTTIFDRLSWDGQPTEAPHG